MLNSKRLYFVNLINKFLPVSSCHRLKVRLYRWGGVKIGENCEIFSGVKIIGNGEVIIGNHVFIGIDALIMCNKDSKIVVEDYALLGAKSMIVTGFHPITPEGPRIVSYEGTSSMIRICEGACCSSMVMILPGVTVHKMAHCVAGSVVTKDVPEYTRVGGVPAKFMKKENE